MEIHDEAPDKQTEDSKIEDNGVLSPEEEITLVTKAPSVKEKNLNTTKESHALNMLGGRNRCTFSKNGLCNEHQVMSSTVMVTCRE